MTTTVKISSASQLDDLLKNTAIVVADFYADWCGPCKVIAPVYEELSRSLQGFKFIKFVKIDTDAHKDIASTYQVTALPTFIVFRDGKVLEKVQGADPRKLQSIVKKIVSEIEEVHKKGGEAGGASGSDWRGAEIPRGYGDVTDQIEIQRCDMLNWDTEAGGVRTLFSPAKPSALGGGEATGKDWVETDTDEQLMLFIPFQSILKLHTLQITSLPPQDDDDVLRPRTIKLFSNKPHNLGFEEAEDMTATQIIELSEKDWNKDGTASIGLRYVKFQNINSLVLFVVEGEGEGEKVRIDRIRLIGEAGEKREMGKLEKIGDEPGE